jgi:hypothetical protein
MEERERCYSFILSLPANDTKIQKKEKNKKLIFLITLCNIIEGVFPAARSREASVAGYPQPGARKYALYSPLF